jgi:hypothetical protein
LKPITFSFFSASANPIDLFRELIMIPHMIGEEIFYFGVFFIDEEDVRCDDGQGVGIPDGLKLVDKALHSFLFG